MNEAEYLKKLARLSELVGSPAHTPEAQEFDELVNEIEAYEKEHFEAIEPPVRAFREHANKTPLTATEAGFASWDPQLGHDITEALKD